MSFHCFSWDMGPFWHNMGSWAETPHGSPPELPQYYNNNNLSVFVKLVYLQKVYKNPTVYYTQSAWTGITNPLSYTSFKLV